MRGGGGNRVFKGPFCFKECKYLLTRNNSVSVVREADRMSTFLLGSLSVPFVCGSGLWKKTVESLFAVAQALPPKEHKTRKGSCYHLVLLQEGEHRGVIGYCPCIQAPGMFQRQCWPHLTSPECYVTGWCPGRTAKYSSHSSQAVSACLSG